MKVLLLLFAYINFAQATPRSSAEYLSRWKKLEINVCWLDNRPIQKQDFTNRRLGEVDPLMESRTTFNSIYKAKVQEIVSAEYTKERTGIHFIGWKSCQEMEQYDLVIITADTYAPEIFEDDFFFNYLLGQAVIGRIDNWLTSSNMPEDKKSYVYLNLDTQGLAPLVSVFDGVLSTALHEFGHVAGLRHEQIRLEAQVDPICTKFSLGEKPNKDTRFFSVYDPTSIMNYCFLNMTGQRTGMIFTSDSQIYDELDDSIVASTKVADGKTQYKVRWGLSRGDVHGLRCMYVYKEEEFKEKCNKDFQPNDPVIPLSSKGTALDF